MSIRSNTGSAAAAARISGFLKQDFTVFLLGNNYINLDITSFVVSGHQA